MTDRQLLLCIRDSEDLLLNIVFLAAAVFKFLLRPITFDLEGDQRRLI